MRFVKYTFSSIYVYTCVVCAVIFIATFVESPISYAEDIDFTDFDIIRNGGFEQSINYGANLRSWLTKRCSRGHHGMEGEWGLRLNIVDVGGPRRDCDNYAFQQLIIPSELVSATLRFDYRADEDQYTGNNTPITFEVSLATSKGFIDLGNHPPFDVIDVIHSETLTTAFEWQEFRAELSPSLISAMQAARNNGEVVFLLFSQTRDIRLFQSTPRFVIDIDNISLRISGVQHVPELRGKVACRWGIKKGEKTINTLNIIDPNTLEKQTIWTQPEDESGDGYIMRGVTWRPDAAEIAFISDHEFVSNMFYDADIYAIKPDGSDVRKITGPLQADLENAPRVTVTGTVQNIIIDPDAPPAYGILLRISGYEGEKLVHAGPGQSMPFTISDVPIIDDPDIFSQSIKMIFSNGFCIRGVDWFTPSPKAVNNGRVDLGIVPFPGINCLLANGWLRSGYMIPGALTWRHDGSEIGLAGGDIIGFEKIPSTFKSPLTRADVKPHGDGLFDGGYIWSPVDDRYLYNDGDVDDCKLYMAKEGGEPQLLVENNTYDTAPAWLPDGSGFVYVGNHLGDTRNAALDSGSSTNDEIFYYDFGTDQMQQLTYFGYDDIKKLSISPDGQYIIFRMSAYNYIMDRLNPTDIWPIGYDCAYPAWSPADVPGDDNDNNGDTSSGSGGGCFIQSISIQK
jgi:hypothetical protein